MLSMRMWWFETTPSGLGNNLGVTRSERAMEGRRKGLSWCSQRAPCRTTDWVSRRKIRRPRRKNARPAQVMVRLCVSDTWHQRLGENLAFRRQATGQGIFPSMVEVPRPIGPMAPWRFIPVIWMSCLRLLLWALRSLYALDSVSHRATSPLTPHFSGSPRHPCLAFPHLCASSAAETAFV